MPTRRLVAPRPSLADRAVALPRQVRTARAAYRATPSALRSPDRAARVGTAVGGLWFAALFGGLAATVGGGVGLALAGAAVAAVCCAALGATRRLRAAGVAAAAGLVLAQAAALAPSVTAVLTN